MKAFPNPLTPAEEKKYIQRYTEGDLEAKHILIERNLRLVAHVIRKYQNTSEDPEDLISIGTIGLILLALFPVAALKGLKAEQFYQREVYQQYEKEIERMSDSIKREEIGIGQK